MKLTDEIWKEMGFVESKNLAGYKEWYHPMRKNQHQLTFTANHPQSPQSLAELLQYILNFVSHDAYQNGRKEVQKEIKDALDL